MAVEPPTPRPRGTGVARPVADWIVDVSPQFHSPAERVGHNGGTAPSGGGVALPASSSNTRASTLGESGSDDTTGGAGSHDDDIVGSGLA